MYSARRLERKYERYNLRNVKRISGAVDNAYAKAMNKISVEISKFRFRGTKPFSFKRNKDFGNKLSGIIGGMNREVDSAVKAHMANGWAIANKKNDILSSQYLRSFKRATGSHPNFFNANIPAMNAFVNRSINGLDLSANVWKQGAASMDLLETYMGTGIAAGRSSAKLSRDVRGLLKEPEKALRRVRGKDGVLRPSKAMKAYKPGRGVYKSSYKNALRMARTETNMAYRQADYMRTKQMDFVIGIQVHLSGAHPKYDICDSMAGKYPKSFQFLGWHPNCFCYQTSILAKQEDFLASLKGTPIPLKNRVTKIPIRAQRYIKDNAAKIAKFPKKPYWVKNNQYFFDKSLEGSVKPTVQIQTDRLMRRAQESGDEVYTMSVEYADKFYGTSTPINYKSQDSILRKATTELNGQVHRIKDAARTTVMVEADQMEAAYAAMKKDPRFASGLKKQTPDKYMGYSGVLGNTKTANGLVCEIQLNTPEMIFAKEPPKIAKILIGEKRWLEISKATGLEGGLGHEYYEVFRKLDKVKDAAKRAKIAQKSEVYYNAVRNTTPKVKSLPLQAKELMARAKVAGDEIYALSLEYAEKFGATSTPLNLKSQKSIIRKAKTELGGDVWKIKDAARTTIIADAEKIDAIYAAMEKDPRFIRLKNQTADKFMGYSGRLTNVSTKEGLIGEIQVNSPEMIFAKEPREIAEILIGKDKWKAIQKATGLEGGLGHVFYEEYRVLDPIKDFAKREKLAKASEKYYAQVRKKGRIKPKEEYYDVLYKVMKEEHLIAENTLETGIAFNEFGEEVVRKTGTSSRIAFTNEEAALFKDAIFTHNHPSSLQYAKGEFGSIGHSFSLADLTMTSQWNAKEARAVTQSYVFSMKRTEAGWPSVDRIKRAYNKAYKEIKAEMDILYWKRGSFFYLNPGAANTMLIHLTNKRMAKKLGMNYVKYKL